MNKKNNSNQPIGQQIINGSFFSPICGCHKLLLSRIVNHLKYLGENIFLYMLDGRWEEKYV